MTDLLSVEPAIHVESREGKFYWALIGEYNNHVLAQGVARTPEMAFRRAQDALYDYLKVVSA